MFKALASWIWEQRVTRFLRSVVEDATKAAVLFLGLIGVWEILKRFEIMGYPADRIAALDLTHYISVQALFLLMCLHMYPKSESRPASHDR